MHAAVSASDTARTGRRSRTRGTICIPAVCWNKNWKRPNRLSLDIGVPLGRITDILNLRRAITADTAVRLGVI